MLHLTCKKTQVNCLKEEDIRPQCLVFLYTLTWKRSKDGSVDFNLHCLSQDKQENVVEISGILDIGTSVGGCW